MIITRHSNLKNNFKKQNYEYSWLYSNDNFDNFKGIRSSPPLQTQKLIIFIYQLSSALSPVPPPELEAIEIDYCESSECPGCPPWPVCDCAPPPLSIDLSGPKETSNTIISESIGTPPIERERAIEGIKATSRKQWYNYRPTPRRHIRKQRKPCPSHPKPIETQPCMCPLILCAAPPPCEC